MSYRVQNLHGSSCEKYQAVVKLLSSCHQAVIKYKDTRIPDITLRRQLLIHKKRKKAKREKNAKTQKEKNMQKEQQNKKITFAPAISTSYLL